MFYWLVLCFYVIICHIDYRHFFVLYKICENLADFLMDFCH
ncbi:hypothetical protein SOHN41_03872 [Shewanella sp. HN-41]|nr:hypothetical protein SOHN41_03872 [Shewanella sp. HN-41]